jgi:ATP-dependent Clp protease ATP-binding subunit ClpC
MEDFIAGRKFLDYGVHAPTGQVTQAGGILRVIQQPQTHFTPLAQLVLFCAPREAERVGNNHVGPEHVFLTMLALGQGGAMKTLQKLGLDLDDIRARMEKNVAPVRMSKGKEEFVRTPRLRAILKFANEEAAMSALGTEHVLLGILREADSLAGQVLLRDLRIDPGLVRQELVHD